MGGVLAVGFAGFIGAILAIFVGYFVLMGAVGGGRFSDERIAAVIRKQVLWCACGGAVAGVLFGLALQLD